MEAILQQLIWLCYSMWLFHLHSVVKIQPFSPVFLLAGATDKAFCRLSLWSFKKKASTAFYNMAIDFIGSVIAHGCFVSVIC